MAFLCLISEVSLTFTFFEIGFTCIYLFIWRTFKKLFNWLHTVLRGVQGLAHGAYKLLCLTHQRQRERSSIHWFTPQMAVVVGVGWLWSQELLQVSSVGAEAQALKPFLLLFKGALVGGSSAGSEAAGHELAPTKGANRTGEQFYLLRYNIGFYFLKIFFSWGPCSCPSDFEC